MTPAERATLRELVASNCDRTSFVAATQSALPKLLDECERLTRARDEARGFVRWRASTDYTPKLIREEMARWDAEDAQAAKNDGKCGEGYLCEKGYCAHTDPQAKKEGG